MSERLAILVVRIVFHDGDDGVGAHETGEIVHVAVGVVADDAFAEP